MTSPPETAQIIQFAARPKAGKKFNLRVTVSAERPEPGAQRDVCGTAENFRLRQERNFAWREATAVMNYWLAVMRLKSAISCVQNYGTPEGDQHEFVTDETHGMLVTKWRAAWACLMLTPAPNSRELNWKRDQIKGKKWKYNGLSAKRIEQAIAEDVEFLRTHPTRRSGKQGMDPKKLEERRAWKAAFRARVTLYAERNGIDKSELAWLGRIKHQDLAAFAERHRLSYNWLLTGEGAPTA